MHTSKNVPSIYFDLIQSVFKKISVLVVLRVRECGFMWFQFFQLKSFEKWTFICHISSPKGRI